jgi:5-methylcytosine-specific restriction endonuclease McrA
MPIGKLCPRNCGKVIPDREKYLDGCKYCEQVKEARRVRQNKKMESRDKPKEFYNSPAWQNLSKLVRARSGGICQMCGVRWATLTHHILPAKLFPQFRLSLLNLESACDSCHAMERSREARIYSQFKDNPNELMKVFIESAKVKHAELCSLV